MKAVVMELREGKAAILDQNGVFRITDNKNYEVGQVLELPEEAGSKAGKIIRLQDRLRRRALPAAAAAAVTILATGGGVAAVTVPVTSVTVQMDSELVYHLNILDRVVSIEDARTGESASEDLLKQVKGKRPEEAMEFTLDLLSGQGEIPEADTPVNVTVESRFGKEKGIEKRLEEGAARWNEKHEPGKTGGVGSVQVVWEPRAAKPAEGIAGEPVDAGGQAAGPGDPAVGGAQAADPGEQAAGWGAQKDVPGGQAASPGDQAVSPGSEAAGAQQMAPGGPGQGEAAGSRSEAGADAVFSSGVIDLQGKSAAAAGTGGDSKEDASSAGRGANPQGNTAAASGTGGNPQGNTAAASGTGGNPQRNTAAVSGTGAETQGSTAASGTGADSQGSAVFRPDESWTFQSSAVDGSDAGTKPGESGLFSPKNEDGNMGGEGSFYSAGNSGGEGSAYEAGNPGGEGGADPAGNPGEGGSPFPGGGFPGGPGPF